MSDLPEVGALTGKVEQRTFEFLQTDLALCNTFADLVTTERAMRDAKGADQALSKAEDGYVAIARLIHHLKDPGKRSEIEEGLKALRLRLDNLRS